jgi:phenylalanyl-tRNA synthetase alpha chain
MATQLLDSLSYGRLLALRDLTDAAARSARDAAARAAGARRLARSVELSSRSASRAAVGSSHRNYDDLGYPPDGASRDARYTRYLTPELLLRTQTSAMIPHALRMIAPARYDDVLIACPG